MGTPVFNKSDFVHLHLHSDYSLLQSTIQLGPLASRLNELGQKACALTDLGNMFGAVSFYCAMKDADVRPIMGYEAFLTSGKMEVGSLNVPAGERPYYNIVLLAKNAEGFNDLVFISSKAYTQGFYHRPRIDFEFLKSRSSGLICLSGGLSGPLIHYLRTGNLSKARSTAKQFVEIFGKQNFFIEIQPHWTVSEPSLFTALVNLARDLGIDLVATNEANYLFREDAKAHEILMCVGEGRTFDPNVGLSLRTDEYYLRSAQEMWSLFGKDHPEALENTVRIAEMCDVELDLGENNLKLPTFPVPNGFQSSDSYLEHVVRDGFARRKAEVFDPMTAQGTLKYPLEKYEDRLRLELGMIQQMGYAGYFLVVWDFVKYAVENNIPVGPGRGSAAGSLVAYCLGITGVDPLQYDLFFERFLNPARVTMPDIDIDFCIRGRGQVIEHVAELYGRDSVCQIITFGTLASRAAIKDVGRALNMPLADVEKIAKLIPPPVRGRNTDLEQAVERVPELRAAMASDPKVSELIDLAKRVEGCARHTSVHAAGVVISPRPLHELIPVAISARNEFTSQYEMGDLERSGMLKMDFLGLTTLTIIADCLRSVREREGVEIDWSQVPLNDEETMQLFADGRTDAVFQFESTGMQEICRRLKPKELEDLSALNALYRPGPIDGGMIEDFILRHRGEKKIKYIVPEMQEILENTFGVPVYQEQIMLLAQKLAGYSLGEADLMRRAMGKKKLKEMASHEAKFVAGAVERGINKKTAKEIFDLIAKFANYGFNRSHSIAYAYLAFQTGYLKAHFPSHFYAAVLSHEADDSSKVYKYSSELRSMGLALLPPDVNESDDGFTPIGNAVRFGLNAIKGLGTATSHAIIEARKSGRFASIFDFVSRVDPRAINRRGLEGLVAAGAFDSVLQVEGSVGRNRKILYSAIEEAIAFGQSAWNDRSMGQTGLFVDSFDTTHTVPELPEGEEWTPSEVSAKEKASLGFYLSSHPLDEYKDVLAELRIKNIADLGDLRDGSNVVIAGIVNGLQVRWSKTGNRYGSFRLEDQSMGVKCLIWSEGYSRHSAHLIDGAILIIEGSVKNAESNDATVFVRNVRPMAEQSARNAGSVVIGFPTAKCDDGFLEEIADTLLENPGRCKVFFESDVAGVRTRFVSNALSIEGSLQLTSLLESKGCNVSWKP